MVCSLRGVCLSKKIFTRQPSSHFVCVNATYMVRYIEKIFTFIKL
jgi:hypothetical protein